MATETTMTTISLVFFIGEAVDRWRCRRKGERGKRGRRGRGRGYVVSMVKQKPGFRSQGDKKSETMTSS